MSELELKFQVPKQQLSSLQRELKRRGARNTPMLARYFDTGDGLLDRHGMSLRLRKEGRKWVQTLKTEGISAVHRQEHSVPLRVATAQQPILDLARHDSSDAGAALRDVLAQAGSPELVERYAIAVVRLSCELRLPAAVVEAALDIGDVKAGEHVMPICELELEYKSGDSRELFALAKSWLDHGGLWLNTLAKSRRGSVLADGHDHGPPYKAEMPKLERELDGETMLRTILQSVLRQVLGNASELLSGSTSDEHVHQMRVGLRRLRTALRELAPLSQGIDGEWEATLSVAFARLGEVRDNEVVAKAVKPLLERAHAPKVRWSMPSTEVDLPGVVHNAKLQGVLLDILTFASVNGMPEASTSSSARAQKHVVARLSKLHQQVVKGGKRFVDLPPEDQHKIRKRLKRLRYLAEFVQAQWSAKATHRYLQHLGPAQDALGAHNDIAVACDQFRQDAQKDPDALFAAGFLQAHLGVTARAAHKALKQVADASPFWKD
jgi:triphosphatase